MKTKIAALAAVCGCFFALCACDLTGMPSGEDGYAALNDMLHADYSEIALTVTNTFGEDTLTGEYLITGTEEKKVSYRVERFAELDPDAQSQEFKDTVEGEAVYRDGFLVSQTDDGVTLPAVLGGGLTFREEYFENAELTGIYLRADVKDAEGFLGSAVRGSDMRVEATFLEFFHDILITYTSEAGFGVEYKYVFTV